MGSCLLFADVFVRRVAGVVCLGAGRRAKMLGRKPPPPQAEMIQRLQSRKARWRTALRSFGPLPASSRRRMSSRIGASSRAGCH